MRSLTHPTRKVGVKGVCLLAVVAPYSSAFGDDDARNSNPNVLCDGDVDIRQPG